MSNDEPLNVIRPPVPRVRLLAAAPVEPVREPATAWQPPATIDEARQRFFDKYGMSLISVLLGGPVPEPETIVGWCEMGKGVKEVLELRAKLRAELRQRAEL